MLKVIIKVLAAAFRSIACESTAALPTLKNCARSTPACTRSLKPDVSEFYFHRRAYMNLHSQ